MINNNIYHTNTKKYILIGIIKMIENDEKEAKKHEKQPEDKIEITKNVNTSPRTQIKHRSKLLECLISFHIPIGLSVFLVIALICPEPGIVINSIN